MNFRNCKNKNYHGLWGGPTKKQPNFQPDPPQEIRARTDQRISALMPPPTPKMTMFPASHMVILKILFIKMTLPYNFASTKNFDLFNKNLTFPSEPNFPCITMKSVQIPFGSISFQCSIDHAYKIQSQPNLGSKTSSEWDGEV